MSDRVKRQRRRRPLRVEALESRALLSIARASTPSQVELVVAASGPTVHQQQGSFPVTLSLRKDGNLQAGATLDQALTVEFVASATPPGVVAPQGGDAVFATFRQTVTFSPGDSTETVNVPIVATATAGAPASVYLTATASGSVRIGGTVSQVLPLYSSLAASPPSITGVQVVTQGKFATALVVGFNKPMDRATVENIANYRVLSAAQRSSSSGFLFWSGSSTTQYRAFPLDSAYYNASTNKVALILRKPVAASKLYAIASAYPLSGHVLTDATGQQLVSPAPTGTVSAAAFTRLVRDIPGYIPRIIGALKITKKDSLLNNFNPLNRFN